MQRGFLGGPCTVTADSDEIQVYARGNDGNIRYRAKLGSAEWRPWVVVQGIDGSRVDNRTELDCAYSYRTTTMTLAAIASDPVGTVLVSTGSAGVFNGWSTPLGGAFQYAGIAVAVDYQTYYGTVSDSSARVTVFGDAQSQSLHPPDGSGVVAPLDMVAVSGGASSDLQTIHRNASNQLVRQVYYQPATPAHWQTQNPVIPLDGLPANGSLSMSPTICGRDHFVQPHIHVAAVVDGQLWYAHTDVYGSFIWSQWERTSSDVVVSSPDCSVASSEEVSIVALRGDGTILRVSGTSGAWQTESLGPY